MDSGPTKLEKPLDNVFWERMFYNYWKQDGEEKKTTYKPNCLEKITPIIAFAIHL